MSKRMLAALVALAGVFIALYLTLYKMGYIGTIACGVGSCDTVQTSKWATFLGLPVGLWGVGYYVAVLSTALVGLRPQLVDERWVSRLLVTITGVGVLFSAWLTYLELYVIHAICLWCVISAVLATILFVVCWLDLREVNDMALDAAEAAAAQLRVTGYGSTLRNTAEVSLRAVEPEE